MVVQFVHVEPLLLYCHWLVMEPVPPLTLCVNGMLAPEHTVVALVVDIEMLGCVLVVTEALPCAPQQPADERALK